jgi:tetratricopeptide (TPR) repeat protein
MSIFYDDEEFESTSNQDMEDKVRHYRQAILKGRFQGSEVPDVDLLEGLVYYCLEKEKYEDALRFCKFWTEHIPYSSDGWQKLGYINLNLGKINDALDNFAQALLINPTDVDTLMHIAVTYTQANLP